jgi:hypothetical protein
MDITGQSAWTFDTSATGDIGIEFVAVQGGAIYLKDPKGTSVRLRMLAAGVGLTYRFKIPKLGKLPVHKIGRVRPDAWGFLWACRVHGGRRVARGGGRRR